MIASNERAMCLHELVDDAYMVVATRGTDDPKWSYLLPRREIKMFHEAVSVGDLVSVQRREADGSWVVLAKVGSI